MALPGLFVEYLVIGSMSLVWFLPLIGVPLDFNDGISLGKAAAFAPAIYVLGMCIDYIAFFVFSSVPAKKGSIKWIVRSFVNKKHNISDDNLFKSGQSGRSIAKMLLYLKSTDLVKELEMRSSRDRIARGAVINLLLLWVLPKFMKNTSQFPFHELNDLVWAGLVIFIIIMWVFFERNSYEFELGAGEIIKKDNNNSHHISS